MKLEELSDKEIAILELLDNKNCIGVKSIARRTGYSYSEILEVMGNRNLLREFRRIKKEPRKRAKLAKKQSKTKKKKKRREALILEAICDKGCRSIQSISDATKLQYLRVWRMINNVNLLLDLKEMKEQDDYELVKSNYKPDIRIGELKKKTGLGFYRIKAVLEKVKVDYGRETPLHSAQKDLATILNQIVLKRAEKEDPAFYYAYLYYNKPRTKLDFEEIYKRTKDIYGGYTISECGRRWGKEREAASRFIKHIGMRELHTKRVKLAKEQKKLLFSEQKNLASILQQGILKRAQEEDPAFYYAYLYTTKLWVRKKNFEKIYKRAKDIYGGYRVSECGRRWHISQPATSHFIDSIGMRKIHREKANYHH